MPGLHLSGPHCMLCFGVEEKAQELEPKALGSRSSSTLTGIVALGKLPHASEPQFPQH